MHDHEFCLVAPAQIVNGMRRQFFARAAFPLEHVDRAGDVRRDIDVVLVLEQTPQSVARMLLVIDNEDGGLHLVHLANYRSSELMTTRSLSANRGIPQLLNR